MFDRRLPAPDAGSAADSTAMWSSAPLRLARTALAHPSFEGCAPRPVDEAAGVARLVGSGLARPTSQVVLRADPVRARLSPAAERRVRARARAATDGGFGNWGWARRTARAGLPHDKARLGGLTDGRIQTVRLRNGGALRSGGARSEGADGGRAIAATRLLATLRSGLPRNAGRPPGRSLAFRRADCDRPRSIAPDRFGSALSHEHVLVDFVGADRVSPARYDANEAYDVALPYLRAARGLGCRGLVGVHARLSRPRSPSARAPGLGCGPPHRHEHGVLRAAKHQYVPGMLTTRARISWRTGGSGNGRTASRGPASDRVSSRPASMPVR